MEAEPGKVYLVGAGPGDAGLITVRGRALLRSADVVIHDRLIAPELLEPIRTDAELIDVGKTPGRAPYAQDAINAMLVARARAGRRVVRLKGGDPFLFGRGWEEWTACDRANVACVVVPGVSSAIAAPASAGIPVTLRGVGRSVAIVTARTEDDDTAATLDYDALARMDTIVIMMGRATLGNVARRLIEAGRDAATPAACIERGTTCGQREAIATLGEIAEAADRARLRAPMVTCVGAVVAYRLRGSAGTFPLVGKRIAVMCAASSMDGLRRLLSEAGADVIDCPLIRIAYDSAPDRRGILAAGSHDWIAFTSVHGVHGFFRALVASGRDARALGGCRCAAVGPATAAALRAFGITADLIPQRFTAAGLLDALESRMAQARPSVLLPRGDIAGRSLPDGLRRLGADVHELVVYRTVPATPSASERAALGEGVDAVVFCSPSAVRRFVELGLDANGAVVACIGPTTAAAASASGMPADIVADEHTAAGLAAALAERWAPVGMKI
ncbi:MAG: uroporphyrinogen-III C-methyltransferase [Phycisphaerae bacterium]